MKKLALLLLPLALSTSVLAQSNTQDSAHNLNTQKPACTEYAASGETAWQDVQFNTTAGHLVTNDQNLANSADYGNNKPKKKSNFNKGYSVAGEVSYNTGIGFYSGGLESGLTAKHFFKGNTAVEGILSAGWRYRGLRLTALYEVQKPLGTNGIYWYWGIGAHTGVFTNDYWNQGPCKDGRYESNGKWYNCDGSRATFGIDGTIGLEYQFTNSPFTIGLVSGDGEC